MLSLLSEDREILGIDYDEDKIALAQHGWLRNEHLQFKHGNALEYPLPESDVFILNDMLHYMSYEHQQTLLLKCAGRLRSQGMIIIRDGNSANASKAPVNPVHGITIHPYLQLQPDNRRAVFHH